MNERIESIAVETLSFLRHNVLSRSDMEDIRIPDAFVERFALLIVRECIGQIDDGNSDHAGGNTDAINRINEHFGLDK